MTTTTKNNQAFNLKADLVAMTVLQITEASIDKIEAQLKDAVTQAPNYFKDAPIIIDISKIPVTLKEFVDLKALSQLLNKMDLHPVGIRGALDKQADDLKTLGLVKLNTRVNSTPSTDEVASKPAENKKEQAIKAKAESANSTTPAEKPKTITNKAKTTKVISKPVRSGMQVYAKDADLLILSSVNPGAEVIADGNIYVFGTLKGRALAGAQGNQQAKIMCQSLDAELVAIAGQYLTKETLGQISQQKGMLHIYLDNKQLMIEPT